jgi:histidinol-phosphate aminotransferase
MKQFWSEGIRNLAPYVPGEQSNTPGLIKLNTNENPYPPSPRVVAAMQAAIGPELRLYPDPDSRELKRAIAETCNVPLDHIFVGNGSDEVLAHAFLALLKHPAPILLPDITYSFYPVYCALYGIEYRAVPVDARLRVSVADYLEPNGGIVIANPNAPTGAALPLADIRSLLQANAGSVVLIDEAYVDFGAESALALVAEFPNLLVVQTLSKSRSLAGMRVGFAVGQPALIGALECVKGCFNSYPLDRLAESGAAAALRDREYFETMRQRIIATRETLRVQLTELGFDVLPSATNFLFARHPAHDGATLHKALRARNILVRHFAKPRIDQFLRISIGTEDECRALVDALRETENARQCRAFLLSAHRDEGVQPVARVCAGAVPNSA